MSDQRDPYAAFRLNFEQQQKRAKELLKGAKAGDSEALARLNQAGFTSEFKLAHAQHCIARELRFANWAALKQHGESLLLAHDTLGEALDGDCRTMHIRCGHDIQRTLVDAGLHGTFNLHINPYHDGPVRNIPNWLAIRAEYLALSLQPYLDLTPERVLEDFLQEEARLADGAQNYDRVVLWFEHDRYDQFVLLRCLAYFAEHGAPPRLELVTTNDFPGSTRFMGLGQLPPEALKLLWERRRQVSAEQLAFARHAWGVFRDGDPMAVAALARTGTPLLPDLAGALIRHLQDFPSLDNSLGLTQRLLLQVMAEEGKSTAGRIVATAMRRDPLPDGDLTYERLLRDMGRVEEPLLRRTGAHPARNWHLDDVEITDTGRLVLAGALNWFALDPLPRWSGNWRSAPGIFNLCWDDGARDVVLSRVWSVHQANRS